MEEMGDLVLGLATEMMTSFDFHPTFTAPFEVANKVGCPRAGKGRPLEGLSAQG